MYWQHFRSKGFTLVEVIASLLLLSTLLVMILVAFRGHALQVRAAQERLNAIAVADAMLAEWNATDQWGAATAAGYVEGQPKLRWRWQVDQPPELQRLGTAIGRLEVTSADGETLASVDVLTAGEFGPAAEAPRP